MFAISRIAPLVTGVVAAVAPTATHAQQINITPIGLTLSGGERAGTFRITNQGSTASTIQIRPFLWSQPDGANALDPTREILVSPPMVAIAPGETQTIRVILKGAPQKQERSYRLYIDQLPQSGGTARVNVLLRVSVPVFQRAPGTKGPDLHWAIQRGEKGSARILVSNSGDGHAHFTLKCKGFELSPDAGNLYVLPQSSFTVPLRSREALRAGQAVDCNTQAGTTTTSVKINAGAP